MALRCDVASAESGFPQSPAGADDAANPHRGKTVPGQRVQGLPTAGAHIGGRTCQGSRCYEGGAATAGADNIPNPQGLESGRWDLVYRLPVSVSIRSMGNIYRAGCVTPCERRQLDPMCNKN